MTHESPNAPVPYPTSRIQNRNVHISVLNGELWDKGQVHYGICEFGLLSLVWFSEENESKIT